MEDPGQALVEANVSATATKIDVKDGVVTLSGNVDNAAQKDLTEAYARDVSNVKSDRQRTDRGGACRPRTDRERVRR